MIIGTAGHVDHGKTALVKALTGVDGDRLKEEKARGITIDLGFAYLPLPDGASLGFVDVPGHERFVRTMVAGASGIDTVLLVIAANEGIKPQTLEHLAIIDLLGVTRGLVVISKADLAEPAGLAELSRDIESLLQGTLLQGAEILPVSAVTGQGLAELRARLANAASEHRETTAASGFRLAIDRVFTLAGIGVVVTGTVLSGQVKLGDAVTISPSGLAARVRSIHAQNRPSEIGRVGQRCALNLAGPDITKDQLKRGDMVIDSALHAPSDRIDARLRLLKGADNQISQWFPVRLHHAAIEVGARLVLLSEMPIQPGEEGDVQLVLDRPIAAAVPDRFVLRDVSAQRTIGGGYFIDLRPPSRRRRSPERILQRHALAQIDPQAALAALLAAAPFTCDLGAFVRDRALGRDQMDSLVGALGLQTLTAGEQTIALARPHWQSFIADLQTLLTDYHRDNPDLQGIGREKLRLLARPRLPNGAFLTALQRLAGEGLVALDGAFVRLASHKAALAPPDEILWAQIAAKLAGGERFRPPRVRDIAGQMAKPEREIRRVMKLAGRMGWADEIAQDHFFLRETVREMVALLMQETVITASRFRDQLDNGRKVAIQILEFFDRHGVTLRKGDLRSLNQHRLDLFGPVVFSQPLDEGGESSPVGRSDFKSE